LRENFVIKDYELLESAVTEALSGKLCISGWLGYGNVLFLGFGPELLPADQYLKNDFMPPYELQTNLAEWKLEIDAVMRADINSVNQVAEQAIHTLLGHMVQSWKLFDDGRLWIEFHEGCQLTITPFSEIDAEDNDSEFWWFCMPNSKYVGLAVTGQVVQGTTR